MVETSVMEYMSKSAVVTSALRELIVRGEFEPGTRLRQRDLAARFGVSATPVREALRRLETEGLIHYDLHRGATVIEATVGVRDENFQIRAALEALAARMAASRITAQELDDLQALHREMEAAKSNDADVMDINRRFHFKIYEAARSPTLLALLRLLWQSLPQESQVSRPVSESIRQHARILVALGNRLPDAAESLTREHILSSIARSHAALRADGDSAETGSGN